MHINQRTKGWAYCTAEAMLLDRHYAWLTHVYFSYTVPGFIDPETMEPIDKEHVQQRGKDYMSIFKDESYKTRVQSALQYLKDYGP